MTPRKIALLALVLVAIALPAAAQNGLRIPSRSTGSGIDPSLAPNNWRDAIGFTPSARMQWSYPLGQYSLGMSMASGRDYESAPIFGAETRQYGLFGRYSLTQDWSLNAETVSREPGAVLRLQDFRIGLRRQF